MRIHSAVTLLAFTAAVACSEPTGPGNSVESIVAIAGEGQIALPNSILPIAPVVKVTDAEGNPVSGIAIDFTTEGTSSVANATQLTDENGEATAGSWTLGGTPGNQRVLASVRGRAGRIALFTANATATAVVAGYFHSCALTAAQNAYCWGRGRYGQLGVGTTADRNNPGPPVAGGVKFKQLVAGGEHTCGLTDAGAAYCWGDNGAGELGDGTTTNRLTPAAVIGGHVFSQLYASGYQTCGLATTGAAYCWGANLRGGLGDGTFTSRDEPTAVLGGLTFVSLAVGGFYACGLTVAGSAFCWGDNDAGQLGDGTTTRRTEPVSVSGGLTFRSLHTGDHHTCGLLNDGTVYCWGQNPVGQLGDRTTERRLLPVPAELGATRFQSMTVGGIRTVPPLRGHTCGLTVSGNAFCWGDNQYGALGDGTISDRSSLVSVSGSLTFESIVANALHTCGLTTQKVLYCWGYNPFGQVGNGTRVAPTFPSRVGPPQS